MCDNTDREFYKTLLESTLAIPWKIDWRTKEFVYIGPQVERLLGWPQSSWKTAQDWIDRIHDADRDRTASECIELSERGIDHEADYRALRPDGSWVWVRDVVHVVREADVTIALIGFMFDISKRKKLELELEALNARNQELLRVDTLTQVANRKALDERVRMEFKRALRNQTPLSVLFVDIDAFKQYNDYYGHLQGDDCLVCVARIIQSCFRRPADFVARYGGEEFVVLLPETPRHEAIALADRCRAAIFDARLRHEKSSVAEVVTASIGVATIEREPLEVSAFLECADRALYRAKAQGRNCVSG